jgi:hypothetical protein
MSDSSLLEIIAVLSVGYILPTILLLDGAYWAFAIRRVLASRLYRNHALWIGALCIIITAFMPLDSLNLIPTLVFLIGVKTLFAFIFAFIDSNIPILRRSDPRFRDILSWKKIRRPLWIILLLLLYPPVFFFSQQSLGGLIFLALSFVPIIIGTRAIFIGVGRSKDAVLRDSLKWFGVFLLCELAQILVFTAALAGGALDLSHSDLFVYLTYSFPSVPSALLVDFGFYALYRSCRSLALIAHPPKECAPENKTIPP